MSTPAPGISIQREIMSKFKSILEDVAVAVVVASAFLLFMVFMAGVFLFFPLIFMVCWNALVPSLFHGPHISFLQSIAAVVILGFVSGGASVSKS